MSRALPVLPARRPGDLPLSTSSENIYEMIPDPKNCDISNKTKNVYTGESNIPDTTSTAIIDVIDQDLDEDESGNEAFQDNDYAYSSVPDPQAKSDHDSSAEQSDLKVKEEILSADIQSQ